MQKAVADTEERLEKKVEEATKALETVEAIYEEKQRTALVCEGTFNTTPICVEHFGLFSFV